MRNDNNKEHYLTISVIAFYLAAFFLIMAILNLGCGGAHTYYDGKGLTIVRKSGVEKQELRVWKNYISGFYSFTYPQPLTIALSPKDLKAKYLERGGSYLVVQREAGLGGFYDKQNKTVYYTAGKYRTLRHEYCHYAHHVKQIGLSPADEEAACRIAGGY